MNWKKVWHFIWHEDSAASWIVNVILAFILIKFLVLPGLGFVMDTSHPVVAVVSGSMEHKLTPTCATAINGVCQVYNKNKFMICGEELQEKVSVNFDTYWSICGDRYEKLGINKEQFGSFSFKNGFNTGDIMIVGSPDTFEVGDVIVFWDGQREFPLIHRVVKQNETHFSTLGDHNSGFVRTEKDVSKEKVIGKALFRVPFLGNIKIWFINFINILR